MGAVRWGGRRRDAEQREARVTAREAAVVERERALRAVSDEISGLVSRMVLDAGALESLTAGAGRDLDPEASRALAERATSIRRAGREVLGKLDSRLAPPTDERAP